MQFDLDLTLPERGDCHVEFSAYFDYGTREWVADDPVTVWLAEEDGSDDETDFDGLDRSSQLFIQSAVAERLAQARPSDSEIEAERDAQAADHSHN